jgi:hypothetical protein
MAGVALLRLWRHGIREQSVQTRAAAGREDHLVRRPRGGRVWLDVERVAQHVVSPGGCAIE